MNSTDNSVNLQTPWIWDALTFANKAAICASDLPQCAVDKTIQALSYFTFEAGKSLAYSGSRFLADGSFGAAKWAGNQFVSLADIIVKKGCQLAKVEEFDIQGPIDQACSAAKEQFDQMEKAATNYIAPKADALHQEQVKLAKQTNAPLPEAFSALQLIGPAVLLSYCSRKASTNLSHALHHFKLLVTGTRNEAVSYTVPTYESNMQGPSVVSFTKTSQYTTFGLLKDVIMESGIATLWAGGAYLTYESILDALKAAGSEDAHAEWMAKALLTTVVVAPTLFGWVKDAFNSSSSQKMTLENKPGMPALTREQIEAMKVVNVDPRLARA
jgi:hypothetical protein